MGFKLVRVDTEQPYKVVLPLGSHCIGRGKFLDCNDNRVSRNHAELIVTSDSILLKSLHQNPCFVKKKASSETLILAQPDCQVLSNGDRFGLIPDNYWYEVIQCSQSESPTDHKQEDKQLSTEKDNVDTQSYEAKSVNEEADCSQSLLDQAMEAFEQSQALGNQAENTMRQQDELEKNIKATVDNLTHDKTQLNNVSQLLEPSNSAYPIETVDNETNQPESSNQITQHGKRTHSDEDISVNKKVKTEPIDPSDDTDNINVSNTASSSIKKEVNSPNNEASSSKIEIKAEPSSPQQEPGTSRDQGTSNADQNKPLQQAQPPTARAPLRERCYYGAECYRKNPAHKAQFSHPGDGDWGPGAQGECPWGARCRRADPRHWRAHQHPPAARPPAARPPGALPHRPQGQAGRRRQRNRSPPHSDSEDEIHDHQINLIINGARVRRPVPRQGWSDSEIGDDDDDFYDPFHTDESDEWQPHDGSQDSGVDI